MTEEVEILKAAQARDEAHRLADDGDFQGGRALLESAAAELHRLAEGSEQSADLLAGAGKPGVRLSGAAARRADELGLRVDVSLTHSRKDAAAVAIAA